LTVGVTLITYDDFAKLDMRVAKVIEVEKIPGKSKIIKGVIDLGDEKRDVIIGGAEYYLPEELVGKTVIALVNLEPRKIGGIESGAMLLAADLNDKPFWLTVPDDVTLGTKIK
jgi:tRNA-binding protein